MDDSKDSLDSSDLIIVGDVRIDLRQRLVMVNNQCVALTRKEFDMLYTLARYPGWAYTKEQLLEAVWGSRTESNPHAVETMIYWLRKKLHMSAHLKIKTMVGYGYRLVVEQNQKNFGDIQ